MVNSCGRPRTELAGGPANPASASSGLRSSREPGQESFRRKPAPLAFMKISAGAAEPDSGCRRAGVLQGCASARFSQGNSDHRSDELWTLARLWPCAARQREPSPTRATASAAEWSSMTLAAKLTAISSTSQHLRLCRPILKARLLLHRSQPILYL